jgi:hypothetical protein
MDSMNKQNLAVEFLVGALGEGQALLAHVITQEAAARKISSRTLARAKAALGVQSRKLGGDWVWILPREMATKVATEDNSVTAVTDTPGPAAALPPASGNPEIALDGETPPPLQSILSAGSGTVERGAIEFLLPDALEPQVDEDGAIPVGDVGGDFDPHPNSRPPTPVEQAVFRFLDPNHPPAKFSGRQWRQLVVDAHRARDSGWLRRAVEAGWRLEDLIDRQRGRGLLAAIAGGTIIRLDNGSATIRDEDGEQWIYGRPGSSA